MTPDGVFVDIGRKMDGVHHAGCRGTRYKTGDKVLVSIRGRDDEGNYTLSTIKVETPRDWSGLEAAFANKRTIRGTVLEVGEGRAARGRRRARVHAGFPQRRARAGGSGKAGGPADRVPHHQARYGNEDVVVDRRVVLEERERQAKEEAFGRLEEGAVVRGTVRSLTDFGAFVDLGGVDGLLHVSDMTYSRGVKPSDVVTAGESIEVKILKINRETRKIALGLKQLAPDPWTLAPEKYQQGSRVKGKVARVADFGAFVELEPGIEGLIHVSEMSWTQEERPRRGRGQGGRDGRSGGAGRESGAKSASRWG